MQSATLAQQSSPRCGRYTLLESLSAGLRVAATFLVDGFVAGTWKVERTKQIVVLAITPVEKPSKQNRADLAEEAERLIRFIEPRAGSYEVRFAD